MITVNPAQANARLSELLDRVEAGEEVIIAVAGVPSAALLGLNQGRVSEVLSGKRFPEVRP